MTAGYSGTPLIRKLGIRPGHAVATVGAPERLGDLLSGFPRDARLVEDPPPPAADQDARYDVVLAFVHDDAELSERLATWRRLLDRDGGLWIVWPKASSPLASDLRAGDVRREGLGAGLVDNKVCAVDDDYSGLRFVYRLEDRPGR